MSDPLDHLARRAAALPFFLAYRLAAHQAAHDLSDLDLAAPLHCTAATRDPVVLAGSR